MRDRDYSQQRSRSNTAGCRDLVRQVGIWLAVWGSFLVAGCSKGNSVPSGGDISADDITQQQVKNMLVKERDLLVQNMSNHNVKLASSRDWSLFFWTDASSYRPVDSVSVFLRLIPDDQAALTHPELRINIRLSQVAWGNKELNVNVTPRFDRVRRDLWGWETKLENCFNSEIPPGFPAPAGAAPLPKGAFLITLLASSPGGLDFRIDHVPIEILHEREHVQFWKSKGKEKGDFLPELIKKD